MRILVALGVCGIVLASVGCSTEKPLPTKEYVEGQEKAREDMRTKPRDFVNGYRDAVNQRDIEEAEARRFERKKKEEERKRKAHRENEEKRAKQSRESNYDYDPVVR